MGEKSLIHKANISKTDPVTLHLDAINGKKWVKFVAMQQDSATLIYDLNAMKGTTKSYLKKIEQAFKTEYFQA